VTSATDVLLVAEQAAPEEIRHHPQARLLVSRLLAAGAAHNKPLHDLAARMSAEDFLTGSDGTPR
jgi:hypothetical protein